MGSIRSKCLSNFRYPALVQRIRGINGLSRAFQKNNELKIRSFGVQEGVCLVQLIEK